MSKPVSQVVIREADLSKSRPPRWAWRRRFVLGSLNLLLGNEGIGKGTLVAWTIARWTRGELPGSLYERPASVGILGDEDSFDDVWTPRLYAVGADLARVHLIERRDGGYVDMKRDSRAVTREVKKHRIRVLFLDQLLDNLDTGVNADRQKPVRDALLPLRALARKLDIAIIGSLHPNKHADTFRRLVAGTAAFNAVSRSSMYLAEHPEDASRRVFVRGKGNLSALPTPVAFSIKPYKFFANGKSFSVPRACDFERSDLTVQDLVAATERPRGAAESKQGDARAMIGQLLPKDDEWHPSTPIFEACEQAGLDHKTVMRAKKKLGIEHRRAHTFPASIEWRWATEHTLRPRVGRGLSVLTVPTDTEHTEPTEPTRNTRTQRRSTARRNTRRKTGKNTREDTTNSRPRASKREGTFT